LFYMNWFEGPGAARTLEVFRALVEPMGGGTLTACTPVPPVGQGVCALCHASALPGRLRCGTCLRTAAQVSLAATAVTPISLYRTGDALWEVLRHYKDSFDTDLRRHLRRELSRLISQYLRFHLGCLAPHLPPGWAITTVPPTHRRVDAQPLEQAIRLAPWLRRRYVRTLRTRSAPEHNAASDRAFGVVRGVPGMDLILLDDTFTTGASVHSAVSALRLAGARVVGVVVVGRVLNPDARPGEARLWEAARSRPFDLHACCAPACRGTRVWRNPQGG
jgi:predicted amidophosphoribosyltransferase